MSIIIFEDVTTESALIEIEANGKKYEGLYVEMDNAPERKYVKGMASEIKSILKKLDRARIDKSADYKKRVEAEALAIKSRLEKANEPFTLLIDEYAAKRADILAKEKAAREAIELKQKIDQDHEFALLLDDKFESESLQREQAKLEREEKLKNEAAENARLQLEREAENKRIQERQDQINREANKEHLKKINNEALDDFVKAGLTKESAKIAVTALASKAIRHSRISY